MCRRPIPNGPPTSARLKPGVSREILRVAPEVPLRHPKPTCSSSRSCRRSNRPGRMRERRRAMAQASRVIRRWPVSLITFPYQSPKKVSQCFVKLAAKLPAPIPPRSRAEPHQRKPTRSHDTPCPSCGESDGQRALFGLLHIGAGNDRPTGLRIGKDAAFRPEKADLDRARRSVTTGGPRACHGGFARIQRP